MNKLSRLTALLLALMILLGSVSLAEGGLPIGGEYGLTGDDWAALVDAAEDKLFFTDEGDTGKEITPESPEQPEKSDSYPYTDVEALQLVKSDASAEASITASGAAILFHEAAGQWQIALGGVWANLSGETGEALTVTRAMMNGQNRAEFRKALGEKNAETGEYADCTQTAVINLIENPLAMFSVSRGASDTAVSDANDGIMTLELANQENMVLVQVVYRIEGTDQPVADAYIGQIAKGSALNTTLTLPRVTGYKANAIAGKAGAFEIPAEDLAKYATFIPPTETDQGFLTLAVTKELSVQDITVYVEYAPAEVSFTVKHMQQNIDDDDYTVAGTVTMTGLTGAPVGEKHAKTYEGFSAIWYDPTTTIAADGSTVVEIHYNREYYLMTFDLGGGYGVEPIFARYGADVSVGTPQRAGYTFDGWVDAEGNAVTVPETMPAKDVELTAKWTEGKAKFIVVYWLDDPDKLDDAGKPVYNYWGSYETEANSGDTVQGETYKDYPKEVADKLDKHEKRYSKYSHADKDVLVKGDGSTVVNVYYHRNEYTLKFYYALEKKETTDTGEEKSKYYVVGGTTYLFGQDGGDVSAITNLDNNYADSTRTGEVAGLPTLNAEGARRNYVLGSAPSQTKNYLYHYISFTAKYGADISEMWPCSVFNSATRKNRTTTTNGWPYMEAFVSAWNGEHRVFYSQHAAGGNETIKGNYNQLDYKLLNCIGDAEDGCNWPAHAWNHQDVSTVAYLCFWENGSDDVNWNVPKLFRYKIWVPVLEGQDTSDLTLSDDGHYYLRNVYDTCDNSTAGEQTAPAIEGFEYTGKYDPKTLQEGEYDAAVYESAMDVNFYYSRNTYDLTFTNYGNTVKKETVAFDQDISGKDFEPDYPHDQEPGALQFVGWYTTPAFIAGTEFEFDTMPAHDVALYAKWELVKHDVNFWIDKAGVGSTDTAQKVTSYTDITHGKRITEEKQNAEDYLDPKKYFETNQNSPYKDYDFAGWYYLDAEGVEKRFDIKTMPIKTDMDIYAKWTSNTPVKFKFRYVHVDANGNEIIELAPPTEGLALPNSPVTMSAKIGTDLTQVPDGNDPLSYIPAVSSHTLDIQVDETKNVFVFKYHMPEKVKYTVQYLAAEYIDVDGKKVLVISRNNNDEPIRLIADKTVETEKAVVTENYVPVPNRMPQATQLRLIVSMKEEKNVIQFLYVENKEDAPYNVSHYIIDHAGKASLHTSETNKTDKIDAEVAVNKLKDEDIPGYTFARAEVAVPTQNGDKWEDKLYDPTVTADQVQYKLPAAGMHVYLYYEPIEYPFKVQYINATTNKKIKDDKIAAVDEYKPYGTTLNTADYVVEIEDYRFVRFDPSAWTVGVEKNNSDPTVNVLTIYYELDVADISITKEIVVLTGENTIEPSDEDMNTEFAFTVKLTPKEGKDVDTVDVTLPDEARKNVAIPNGTLTFALKDGQTVIIHDLWIGTQYEIEEADYDSFTTTYSVTPAGTLTALGVDMEVANTFPKYAGELTIKKTGMQENKESAIVKATVGGVDYYLVLNGSNGYTATITGIRPDTNYTVSEIDAWTWQYGGVNSISGKISADNMTPTETIANTYKGDQWLHDESHVINDFEFGQMKDDYND